MERPVLAPVVEDAAIEDLDLLDEMLPQRELEIPAAVLVALGISRHREDAARLPLQAGADQGGQGDGLLVGIPETPQSRSDSIEKSQVLRGEEDALEGLLDEPVLLLGRAQEPVHVLAPQNRF